jgi:hypothetical protein
MDRRLQVLRETCDRSSQKAVGRRLRGDGDYPSDAIVNQVLQGKYRGDNERFWRLVDGVLLGVSVRCPVLGELRLDHCIANQEADYSPANGARVRLWRACRSCPNALAEKEEIR